MGMELTLGTRLLKAVVFDCDYRSKDEVLAVYSQLSKFADLVHIHSRKEVENYLLIPKAIDRAIINRIKEHNKRTNDDIEYTEMAGEILESITSELRLRINSQFLPRRTEFEKAKNPGLDATTISQRLLEEFEQIWGDLSKRLKVVPGKEILSQLNKHLQGRYKVTLTPASIIKAMLADEIPEEIVELIRKLEDFRLQGA